MDMFDEARTISGLLKMRKMTQSEIARTMGVSQSYIANKIRLLKFSEAIQKRITEAGLTERHARTLLRLKSERAQESAIEKIKAMRLGVAASEVLIDELLTSERRESISSGGGIESIIKFEEVVTEAVTRLRVAGIRARVTTDIHGKKRYLTVTIEETNNI